jgi:hypothetical protein
MQKFQFVTVDTILAKYSRDFRGLGINTDDAIEWVGEALGFMKIAAASEEAVAFVEVKNYQVEIPKGLHYILQIGRKDNWTREEPASAIIEGISSKGDENCADCGVDINSLVLVDADGRIIVNQDVDYYRPYFDVKHDYSKWTHSSFKKNNFSPVTLSDASFFNSIVSKEQDKKGLYLASSNEYTIVQDQLRFNFKEGFVSIAYYRQMVDCTTGYPMVPDDESAKAAITYYLGWKTKEREGWNHREGSMQLAQIAEARWLKYIKQFKNKAKMPQGLDQYQKLLEGSFSLLPNHKKYYGYFGKKSNNNYSNNNYTNNNGTFVNKNITKNTINNIISSENFTNTNEW